MKKMLSMLLVMTLLLSVLAGCGQSEAEKNAESYKKAMALYEEGKYEEAAQKFEKLGDYKESADKTLECKYLYAGQLCEEGAYADAVALYEQIPEYNDVQDKLAEANTQLMYQTYAPVFDALSQGAWFFEASSENAVNGLTFTKENAVITQIYYDGNGKHTQAGNNCSYVVDDQSIRITLADGSVREIAYTMEGEQLTLAEEYFTTEQVMEGLNGYWGIYHTSYNVITGFSTAEYIYYYDNGKITFESASEAYGRSDGSYYYYGPDEGTYTVDANGLQVDAKNSWQFGFVIREGQVMAYRCTVLLERYEGFKGEDGFSFK